jgi:hypothetical protein
VTCSGHDIAEKLPTCRKRTIINLLDKRWRLRRYYVVKFFRILIFSIYDVIAKQKQMDVIQQNLSFRDKFLHFHLLSNKLIIVLFLQVGNFSAISWPEQVTH